MEEFGVVVAHVALTLVASVVFVSAAIVRGIIWLIVIIANQFGWNLGHVFVNTITLGLAVLFTIYLGVGYFQMPMHPETLSTVFSPVIVYPVILLTTLLWIAYFCAPTETSDQTGAIKIKYVSEFMQHTVAVVGVLLLIVVTIAFSTLQSDIARAEREKIRLERCLSDRAETGDKLKSLAEKVGIGESLSDEVSKKLLERCK